MLKNSNRIAIFSTAYGPFIGGSELAIQNIVERLPDIKFEIITPRFDRSLEKLVKYKNITIHRVGLGLKLDKFLLPVLGFFKASSLSPEIIHAYQASYGGGAAWLFRLLRPETKFILTLQEGKDLESQNLFIKLFRNLIMKKADVITAISTYLEDYARKINPRAEFFLIPNGVDVNKFKFLDKQFGNTIITVSRLVPKNGIEYLVRAIPGVLSEIREAKLIIVGSGPLENKINKIIKELNLSSEVELVGEVKYDNLPLYLSRADLFIRPSLSEGLGTAFLEAMSSGLPVIGSRVGGITDFIRDGETGFLVEPKDVQSLSSLIINVLRDKEEMKKISVRARKLVGEEYNWSRIAEKFKILYHKF